MSDVQVLETFHRFADASREPCEILAPLEGYGNKPLKTIEEATKPLHKIVPRIEIYVHVVKERSSEPADDLSVDESAAIKLYTMEWSPYTDSLYYILNQSLRALDRNVLEPWGFYLKLIFNGLSRLKSRACTVFRGVQFPSNNEFDKYQQGKEIVWWGFSSCSITQDIAEKNHFLGETGLRALLVIDCLMGKNIERHSYYKAEKEILLLPATTVKVVKCTQNAVGLRTIYLKEIKSSISLREPEPVQLVKKSGSMFRRVFNRSHLSSNTQSPQSELLTHISPKLASFLDKCEPNSIVNLHGALFKDAAMDVIVQQLIIDKRCRKLNFRENDMTSQGAKFIAQALQNNPAIDRLYISDNKIAADGVKLLAEALSNGRNTKLKELCLSRNKMTDEAAQDLGIMLKTNTTLTHLILSQNGITDRGFQNLIEPLITSNCHLQSLWLAWNKFGDNESFKQLSALLQSNTTLLELNLSSNLFTTTNIVQLRTLANDKANFKLIIS
jgi:hypothetical protein